MKRVFWLLALSLPFASWAQTENPFGELHGNFQFDGNYYFEDPKLDPLGEDYPDEQFLGQGFANFIYTRGSFSAGVRYENYQNPLLGYPEGFVGEGITYRFLRFEKDGLDITVGNFYEQFGSGMIFRTFEERLLGLDNAMDGVRLIYSPVPGLKLKGIIGKQRVYFDKGEGIVRGLDADFNFNSLLSGWSEKKNRFSMGVSLVSKYQADLSPIYNLPENVGSAAVRFNYGYGGIGFSGEFVHKINDPSADNGYIFKNGNGLILTTTYSTKGFGFVGSYKMIDNMAFRSERDAGQFELFMNFLPPTTKFHTYALPALYPYATQINGETGIQLEFTVQIPKGSFFGGDRGASITANFSDAYSIVKNPLNDSIPIGQAGTDGYTTEWFKFGKLKYFQDFNVSFSKSTSSKFKYTVSYYNIEYSQGILGSATNAGGLKDNVVIENPNLLDMAYINAVVFEGLLKLKKKHSLRFELQGLFSQQDRGDMAMLLLEYSIAPQWFFAAQNIYNYGNPDEDQRLSFPLVSMGYITGTTRFQLNFGRQQRGIFCVGGICRVVPASNSVGMSITSNF